MFNQKPINSSGQRKPIITVSGEIGSKDKPFDITYRVRDPNNESITVVEKLNGVTVNTRPSVAQDTDLIFEITQDLWDGLAINAAHYVTIEAENESGLSRARSLAFYRQNFIPTAPEVTEPTAGMTAQGITVVKWNASVDLDADQEITYKVFYSKDDSGTKTMIAADIVKTELIWDVSNLFSGSNYRIYVCANDGIEDGDFGASGVFKVVSKKLSVPQYVEVKDTYGNTVALLSPESDGLKECWIDDEQNGVCALEFELPLSSDKWQYLTDQYRIYADGKEFVILNPDAVDRHRDGKKLTGKVKAHESWVLLGKKYQTVSNDPQNPNPPWGAVIIVSGGAAHGGYAAGSAGSALSYLLQGTGWAVGTVDAVGTYDLETEKENVLYNINQVQEKWGGIIVWDSVNKTVSLRDEETWQNYTGYQIRYTKNLKGISRSDDYDIVTRLYPFGENDLNIASVNGGKLYLDNQSYSTDVLEGVWYNQDIADQAQLKVQAIKQLEVMCKPRHNYKTEVLDLRSLPGYGHEDFKRSDMIDLIDEDFGANTRVRIIRYRHNVFQPWLCEMELGDPIEKIAASLAQTVVMAKFYKNVVKPNESFQNLLKAIINTEATEINGASGDYSLVDGVSTWLDRDDVTGALTGKMVRITPKGLIISYDGGQTWKLAISGEGIHADAGWVGKLDAGMITVGANTTFEDGYDPSQISSFDPGYVQATSDGIKVYDASSNLRVLVGSWIRDAIRRYGIKIVEGEIYASKFKTGEESSTSKYIEIGATSTYGYISLTGTSGKVLGFDTSADQGKVTFYDDGTAKGTIMINGTSTKELWLHGQNGAGINLSGYNGEYITLGSASGVTRNGIAISSICSDVNPKTDGGGNIGSSNSKWWTVYSRFLNTGDLNFIETECAICGERFNDGDILVLLVKTINDEGYTMTIPVHDRCKHLEVTITLLVPAFEKRYKLDEYGQMQEFLAPAFDEIEEEIIRINPEYELDEKTGEFRRRITEDNLRLFDIAALEKGVKASKDVALVTDTTTKKVPKTLEYTFKMNSRGKAGN